MRLGLPAGRFQLGLGCVFIAPAQVFRYGAGEQDVLLQHHGNRVAQRIELIVAHVPPADEDPAALHVVQARYELDERRLRGAGAAQDPYLFAERIDS